jgi:hypothetical protein
MAATSKYPESGTIVRGDPLTIPVNITQDGDPIDVSGSDWRAQVRPSANGALVVEFATSVITPSGGSVPSTVLLSMSGDDTAKLKSGYVFDLEELDSTTGDTIRTWWICTGLQITDDVSRDDPGPITVVTPVATSALTPQQELLAKGRARA